MLPATDSMPRTEDGRSAFLREAAANGLTLEEIGRTLGVTRERARQLLNRMNLNEDRLSVKRVARDQALRGAAIQQYSPTKRRIVELLQRNGLDVKMEHRPCAHAGNGYRLVPVLDGRDMVIRTASDSCVTGPAGVPYWRLGPARDRNRPHVLATPFHIYVWLPRIRVRYLYVRDERIGRRPGEGSPGPRPTHPPDFTIPVE